MGGGRRGGGEKGMDLAREGVAGEEDARAERCSSGTGQGRE